MKALAGICCLLLLCTRLFAAEAQPALVADSTQQSIKKVIDRVDQLVLKNPNTARKLAERSLLMSKQIGFDEGIGQSFYQIGRTYWVQTFIPVSQFYFNLAIPHLKSNKTQLAECYTSMARNFVDLQVFDTAHYYYNKALKLIGNDVGAKAGLYTGLTALYATNKDYGKCLEYIDTAFKYARKINDKEGIAILYSRQGQVFLGQDKLDSAAEALNMSYNLGKQTQNTRLLASVLLFQAELALEKKEYPKSLQLAKQGYDLADQIGSIKFKLRGLLINTKVYEAMGDFKNAFRVQKQRLDLRREADDKATQGALQLVQDYSSLNKQLNEIEVVNRKNHQNETEIKQQHRTIALLIALLVTTIAITAVIYFFFKQNGRLNTQLQQQHQTLLNQKQLIEMQHSDLEAVNRVKDKLLAIIGHDLRSPIANLSSIADLFAAGLLSPEETQKLMTDIVPIIRGAELTLSNLTDFAGNQIKGKKVNTVRFDVCAAVNEAEEVFKHQLKQKSIVFVNVCQDEFWVNGDESQVKVILRNLISNAIKFTNDRGQITVSMRQDGNDAVVCIRDTGVGMTEAQAAKLFNYNEHLSEKGTMGEKGTGIGLLLCRELVTLNNGRIWLETQIESGCKVCFTLPLAVV